MRMIRILALILARSAALSCLPKKWELTTLRVITLFTLATFFHDLTTHIALRVTMNFYGLTDLLAVRTTLVHFFFFFGNPAFMLAYAPALIVLFFFVREVPARFLALILS